MRLNRAARPFEILWVETGLPGILLSNCEFMAEVDSLADTASPL